MTTLGEYLRARRDQLRPEDVGLADRGRRRAPGLRREEVAALAGVSVDYLTRLEQGRDTNPSAPVLRALADALRVDEADQRQLWHLAAIGHRGELCPAADAFRHEVRPEVQALLDRLDRTPAVVLDQRDDVLASTAAWQRLVEGVGLLEHDPPNLAHHHFTDPRARRLHADWSLEADRRVRRLRAASPHLDDDPQLAALVEALREVPDFERRWTGTTGAPSPHGGIRLDHPEAGRLDLSFEVLDLAGDLGQQLVTWVPTDEGSEERLATLLDGGGEGPRRLRVVG